MSVRETSLEAFHKLKASGQYATQKAAIAACVDVVGPAESDGQGPQCGGGDGDECVVSEPDGHETEPQGFGVVPRPEVLMQNGE